jgi:hypothetical protein
LNLYAQVIRRRLCVSLKKTVAASDIALLP